MLYKIIHIILLSGFCIWIIAPEIETVPSGSPPLVNGIDNDQEWLNSGVMKLNRQAVSVSLKQDYLYVYLNVADSDTLHSDGWIEVEL